MNDFLIKSVRQNLLCLSRHGLWPFWSDEKYLKELWKHSTGTDLNLEHPVTFNEKLQWLKLYDRKPEYTMMVDKYRVREYIAEKLGEKYLIPLLGVWNDPDEIDFDALPDQFVLKCNHNSGTGMCICKDKSKLDIRKIKRELRKGMKENYYAYGREWPYKDVPRKIIAEKFMVDESGLELKDYKVFNFDGEPKFIQVDFDRFREHKRNLYSIDWEYIEAAIEHQSVPKRIIKRPKRLDEMLEMARKLSDGIPHVRTDFYSIDDHVYFGELTFYHGSGFEHFLPKEFENEISSWLKLPGGGISLMETDMFCIFIVWRIRGVA